MWNIKKIIRKGDYQYALVPDHPKATKNGYVLLHRIIVENYLNRMLEENEIVHHKDGNKKNNTIENLEVMDRIQHVKLHGLKKGHKVVLFKCPWCEKEFVRNKNNTHLTKPSKYNCTCCDSSCRGKLYRYIQVYGLNPELEKKMKENVIKEYLQYTDF